MPPLIESAFKDAFREATADDTETTGRAFYADHAMKFLRAYLSHADVRESVALHLPGSSLEYSNTEAAEILSHIGAKGGAE